MRFEPPVANGLRTDHPVPGLPFVDDSHLPIRNPLGIEAHGRHTYNEGWGREDRDHNDHRRWSAFTTDQFNLDYAWLVRNDPGYGRTVLLYAGRHVTDLHETSPRPGNPLAYRAGGYWWDGQTWYRPHVTHDLSTHVLLPDPAPGALSVTAREYLSQHPSDARTGTAIDITIFSPQAVHLDQWPRDLAYWASCRPDDGLALDQCIVEVTAPELHPDALLEQREAASVTELSRAEMKQAMQESGATRPGRFPLPQRHTHQGHPRWARPVLLAWSWERKRTCPERLVQHLRQGERLHDHLLLHTIELAVLWEMRFSPDRTEGHIDLGAPVARTLGWLVTDRAVLAENLFGRIVRRARHELHLPDPTIQATLRAAVLWSFHGEHTEVLDEFLHRVLPPSLTNGTDTQRP